jgi:hypothetical protein
MNNDDLTQSLYLNIELHYPKKVCTHWPKVCFERERERERERESTLINKYSSNEYDLRENANNHVYFLIRCPFVAKIYVICKLILNYNHNFLVQPFHCNILYNNHDKMILNMNPKVLSSYNIINGQH